mmetsp:Transcript_20633/g.63786  ORF Transcript_20633/g.63786 Transcript_20633/m.63786 type:complete len:212 (-) Transcript_20633:61-696(-)
MATEDPPSPNPATQFASARRSSGKKALRYTTNNVANTTTPKPHSAKPMPAPARNATLNAARSLRGGSDAAASVVLPFAYTATVMPTNPEAIDVVPPSAKLTVVSAASLKPTAAADSANNTTPNATRNPQHTPYSARRNDRAPSAILLWISSTLAVLTAGAFNVAVSSRLLSAVTLSALGESAHKFHPANPSPTTPQLTINTSLCSILSWCG